MRRVVCWGWAIALGCAAESGGADGGVINTEDGGRCTEARFIAEEACVPRASPDGRFEVRLAGSCGGCADRVIGCEPARIYEEPNQRVVELHPICSTCNSSKGCSAEDLRVETRCEVGPLPAGGYEIRLDNLTAGLITVGEPDNGELPCFDPRAAEGARCTEHALAYEERCGHSRIDSGSRAYFQFAVPCGPCELGGLPCEVAIEPGAVRLNVRGRTCWCDECGACEPMCYGTAVGCTTPPLQAGNYEVFANEEKIGELEVSSGAISSCQDPF